MQISKKSYALAIDLDGTALNEYGKLSEKTRQVFDLAIKKGYEIIVASGRALESLPEEIRSYDGIRYAITSNGAAIHDLVENQVIRHFYMKPESVLQIIGVTKEEAIAYECFIDGHGFGEEEYVAHPENYGVASAGGIHYIQSTRKPVKDMVAFMKREIHHLDCIDLVIGDLHEKQRIWERVSEKTEGVLITTSVDRLIEIADEKAGKGNAFSYLLELLEIPKEKTAAFGNAENDIDMMKMAAVGYAVANADRECLMAADQVVASNRESGVAEGILDFISRMEG